MSEHTPGPWEVCYSGKYPGIDHSEGSLIIFGYSNDECGIRGECRERRLADAHLIAAAPLMYEALDEAVKSLVALQSNVSHAAKSGATRWEGVSEALQPFIDKARAALQAAKGGENA